MTSTIWNRTRAKAEPLAAKGGKVVDKPVDLGGVDVLFSIVSTGKDLKEVLFGPNGAATGHKVPPIVVDCSTIAVEDSAKVRAMLKEHGCRFRRRAGERQRQGDQGRQAVGGDLRSAKRSARP